MLTFHLIITLGKITLGNEAMQTGEDVAVRAKGFGSHLYNSL